MRDERDEIRARIDIVDLVGQRVPLKRAGRHWKGLCPFHDDRNPSFYVSAETGRYKCWSCGEGGDAFNWVMKTQNVEFVEALKILALAAGVELKGYKSDRESGRTQNLEIMAAAQAFYRASIAESNIALEYCRSRGLDSETIEAWGIGFSPASDHALATQLRRAKHPLAIAKELFLVENDGTGAFFDKFRSRLMFPIHDERGDLVAFGGRALGDAMPKYVHSSDTPLFRKSRVLYGLHRAKDAIAKKRKAILVEGYLDVIACHRAGVQTAVASLGTSLAEEHAKLLRRWCDEALILYDADAAGEKAAARACELLQAEGLTVRIALLPKGQDPDTLLQQAGPGAVQAAVESGLTPTEFRVLQIEKSFDPQSEDFWAEIVLALAETQSLAEAEKHFAYLKGRYLQGRGAAEEQLRQRIREAQRAKSARRKSSAQLRPTASVQAMPSAHPAEAVILRAFLESDLRFQAYEAMGAGLLQSERGSKIARALLDRFSDGPPKGPPSGWLSQLDDEEAIEYLNHVLVHSPFDGALVSKMRPPVSHGEFADSLLFLKNEQEMRGFGSEAQVEDLDPIAALRSKHAREAHRWEG